MLVCGDNLVPVSGYPLLGVPGMLRGSKLKAVFNRFDWAFLFCFCFCFGASKPKRLYRELHAVHSVYTDLVQIVSPLWFSHVDVVLILLLSSSMFRGID